MALGRYLPRPAGHALARVVTGALHRRKSASLYRILYDNQSHVLGPSVTPGEVDAAVRAVLMHAGITAFDLMKIVAHGENAIRESFSFDHSFWETIGAARAAKKPVIVCGAHLSNFNLAFLRFAIEGFPLQVLSTPAKAGGFKILADLRNRGVLIETPIDGMALRNAIHRLRVGGAAVTGIDWPLNVPPGECVPFFGEPACVPTGHIRLAMSSGAMLMPMACRCLPDGRYVAMTGEPIELELTGDREADVLHNARRVLEVFEAWIAEAPNQWLMYHRIWPERHPASYEL